MRRKGVPEEAHAGRKVLMAASVASMIDQFNLPNIRLLLEMGFEVHVACNFMEGNTCSEQRVRSLLKTLRRMQVRCHQWDCPRNIYSVKKCARAYCQMLKLMDTHRFAWMHCQSPAGGALARLAGRRKHVRMIYTAHGFHFYKGAPWKNWLLYYPAEKLLARWTDVIITVNREDYWIACRKLKAGRICNIPGVGIDIPKFRGQPVSQKTLEIQRREFCRKYRMPENARILLSVGELSRRKNHQAVIAALAGLQDKNVYYLICGQGEQKSRLEEQARALGVSQRVRLAGFQENVRQLYRNADIFVFPSLQEGLPAALMEAMAAGLPCVVSDIRGNRELIDAEGGVRFVPEGGHFLKGKNFLTGRNLLKGGHFLKGKNFPTGRHIPTGGRRFRRHGMSLIDSLETLLENESLRQACGRHNQMKVENYGLEIVNCRMKKIYAAFDRECRRQAPAKIRMRKR